MTSGFELCNFFFLFFFYWKSWEFIVKLLGNLGVAIVVDSPRGFKLSSLSIP